MYVDRNAEGIIVGLYNRPQRPDHEYIEGASLPEDAAAGNVRAIGKHQLMMQLIADGNRPQWDDLKTMIDSGNADLKEVWELTPRLSIDHPLIQPFAESFDYDAEGLQALWNRADKQ